MTTLHAIEGRRALSRHAFALGLTLAVACAPKERDFGPNDGNSKSASSGGASATSSSSRGGASNASSPASVGGASVTSASNAAVGGTTELSSSGGAGGSSSTRSNANSTTIDVVISGTGDLVGYPSQVTAKGSTSSNSSTLSFEWSVTAVPSGSTITTEKLSEKNTDSASFVPDRGGDYTLKVVVRDGESQSEKSVVVTAQTFDVGYLRVAGDNTSYSRSGAMVRSDGTNDRLIGCPYTDTATSESEWISGYQIEGMFFFQAYLPADITADARIYYAHSMSAAGASSNPSIQGQFASATTECSTVSNALGGYTPVFSPNGRRLALYVQEDVGGTSTTSLITMSVDGTDRRNIRVAPSISGLPSPSWADNEHLVWAERAGSSADDAAALVYKAVDRDNAFLNNLEHETLMSCVGAANPLPPSLSQVVEKNGVLYLNAIGTKTSGSTTTSTKELYRLEKVGGEYPCDTTASTTHVLYDQQPHSFEISPDGSKVIFYVIGATGTSGAATETSVMISSTEPGSTAAPLVPPQGAVNIGARWVAGGRQVVWTKTTNQSSLDSNGNSYNRPVVSELWIVNADGTNPRLLTSYSSISTQVRAVNTGSLDGLVLCGIGRASTAPWLPWAIALLGSLLVIRRRHASDKSFAKKGAH